MNFKFKNLSFTLMLAGSLIVSVAYAMNDEDEKDTRPPPPFHKYGSEPMMGYNYGSEPMMGYNYGSEPMMGYNYGSEN